MFHVLFGVVGFIGLLLGSAMSMTWAARGTSRALGVDGFQWFDARPASATWWQRLLVQLASVAAPLVLSIVLFCAAVFVGGVPQFTATVSDVADGPARAAGMRSGDRVLRIGSDLIADWDELRAAVKQHAGPTDIEVERAGRRLVLTVTPHKGIIGVAPHVNMERISLGAAAWRGVQMPFKVMRATFSALTRTRANEEKPGFVGPASVVEDFLALQGSVGAFLNFWAQLSAYVWPFLAGVVIFDAVAGRVFRGTHPEAATSDLHGYRLERLRQTASFGFTSYVLLLLIVGLATSGLTLAPVLAFCVMPAACAGYALTWIAGKELWGKPLATLLMLGALFVPFVLLFVLLALHSTLGRALRAEGFRVTWLSARPPVVTPGSDQKPAPIDDEGRRAPMHESKD